MRPWWCVLLIAGLAAGDKEVIKTKVALPVAPKAGKPASVPKHPPLVVTLTKEGRIIVSGANLYLSQREAAAHKVTPGFMHVSLQRLSVLLRRAIGQYEKQAQGEGTSAFHNQGGYGLVFVRKLHIRADKDAPWAFVQWTAMVAAERKITKLQLALEGERTIDLPLPALRGAWRELVMHVRGWPQEEPPPHVVVDVCRGKRTHYVVDKEETTKPGELEAMLRKRLAGKKPAPKVVVRADLGVPFQDVVTTFDRIHAAGAKEMWWLGDHRPQPEIRKLERLPPPPR